MKNIKWSSIAISICYIAAGFVFFYDASITRQLISTWIGYILLVIGTFYVMSYFIRSKYETFLRNEFRDGLIMITLGLLPLIKKDMFIELVYLVLALLIMVSGYKKLQDCVDAYRLGQKQGLVYLVLSAVSIVIGLVIIIDTTIDIRPLHYLIGGGLMFSGVSDLVSSIFLSSKMNEHLNKISSEKEQEEPANINDEENDNSEVN